MKLEIFKGLSKNRSSENYTNQLQQKVGIKIHSLVVTLLNHVITSPLDKLPTDKQTLYNELPDTFTTSEGVEVAESMGIAERTFKYFISNRDLFNNLKRGEYEKRI